MDSLILRWASPRPTSFTAGPFPGPFSLPQVLSRAGKVDADSPTPGEGQKQVYEGSDASYTDKNLTNGTTYYYTAFTTDYAGNWSGGAQASGMPIVTRAATLTLSSSEKLVSYKGETQLTGKLSTSAGLIPEEKTVSVQRSTDRGRTWKNDGTATYDPTAQTYGATRSLSGNAYFRFRFAGDPYYAPASSPSALVKVRAYLTQPVTPDSVKKGSAFTTSGFLEPRHSGYTRLYFYRYASGRWQLYEYENAKNANYDATTTKYTLRYKLPKTGTWMVKARHKDASHDTTWSPARNFAVRR